MTDRGQPTPEKRLSQNESALESQQRGVAALRRTTDDRFLVRLEVRNPTKYPLDRDLLTLGRSDAADIRIDGNYISRIHARILRIGMDTVIEDAGSKNGTWVNTARIERHVLKHGDLIRVGNAHFRFCDTEVRDAPAF